VEGFDFFSYFWLAGVVFIGGYNLAWGVREIRTGVARMGRWGTEFARAEQPFEYWMTIIGRFAGVVVAVVMFFFGLQMLRWK
jgi:hypothetical protein